VFFDLGLKNARLRLVRALVGLAAGEKPPLQKYPPKAHGGRIKRRAGMVTGGIGTRVTDSKAFGGVEAQQCRRPLRVTGFY
jgi:hypothetical protein